MLLIILKPWGKQCVIRIDLSIEEYGRMKGGNCEIKHGVKADEVKFENGSLNTVDESRPRM